VKNETEKVGEIGHHSLELGQSQDKFNQNLSYKMRLKVLQGRFAPNSKDKAMILRYRESGKTPEDFLKTWKV